MKVFWFKGIIKGDSDEGCTVNCCYNTTIGINLTSSESERTCKDWFKR